MDNIALFDETFDKNQTHSYHLYIQDAGSGLTACILDSTRKKYISFIHYTKNKQVIDDELTTEFESFAGNNEILNRKYKSVTFMYISPRCTLVPLPLFDETNLNLYFEFNLIKEENEEILFNIIKAAEAAIVFSIPNTLKTAVQKKYPSSTLLHQSNPFICHALTGTAKDSSVWLNIDREFIDIAVVEKRQLLFYNTFNVSNITDILYFILYVYKLHKLSIEFSELIIFGEIEKGSPEMKEIEKYIKNSRLYKVTNDVTLSYTFHQLPLHQFANLLSLYSCEL
jgi:hypothetical protein